MKAFFEWDGDTLMLNVKVKPRAKRDAIGKVIGERLSVHVAEAPERGKATAHLIGFLAEEFQVTKAAIEVVSGAHNVNKRLRIAAPRRLPAVIPPRSGSAAKQVRRERVHK